MATVAVAAAAAAAAAARAEAAEAVEAAAAAEVAAAEGEPVGEPEAAEVERGGGGAARGEAKGEAEGAAVGVAEGVAGRWARPASSAPQPSSNTSRPTRKLGCVRVGRRGAQAAPSPALAPLAVLVSRRSPEAAAEGGSSGGR